MNKKLNLLILSFIASLGVFAYLTYHHYLVKLGLGGASLCQLSATVNCDIAALSKYSEILNIPIAVLGLSYSVVMLGFFGFARLGWLEESNAMKAIIKLITAASAVFSIYLLIVSVAQLKAYCPFCIAAYILSFAIVYLTWSYYSDSNFKLSVSDILAEKGFLGSLLAIPFLAWFVAGSVRDNYGLDQLTKVVPEKIYLWQNAPVNQFDANLGLTKGSTDPNAPVLVEFADFKCPHCKTAANTIKNFLTNYPQVKMVFKPYPLDGNCNASIPTKGDGTRCELAGWTLCAEKLFNKGWDVHYWIFDHQEELIRQSDLSSYLTDMGKTLNLDSAQIKSCATSAETYDTIRKTAAEGDLAQITGTPSIFVNGKKLEHGQFIDVLRAAVDSL